MQETKDTFYYYFFHLSRREEKRRQDHLCQVCNIVKALMFSKTSDIFDE